MKCGGFMRFNNKQIEELFASAVKAKRDGVSLVDVFNKTAERYGMSAGSVRNIYYSNLKRKNQKGLRAKKIQPFTKQEEEDMLRKVLVARGKTTSMRSAFLQVATASFIFSARAASSSAGKSK